MGLREWHILVHLCILQDVMCCLWIGTQPLHLCNDGQAGRSGTFGRHLLSDLWEEGSWMLLLLAEPSWRVLGRIFATSSNARGDLVPQAFLNQALEVGKLLCLQHYMDPRSILHTVHHAKFRVWRVQNLILLGKLGKMLNLSRNEEVLCFQALSIVLSLHQALAAMNLKDAIATKSRCWCFGGGWETFPNNNISLMVLVLVGRRQCTSSPHSADERLENRVWLLHGVKTDRLHSQVDQAAKALQTVLIILPQCLVHLLIDAVATVEVNGILLLIHKGFCSTARQELIDRKALVCGVCAHHKLQKVWFESTGSITSIFFLSNQSGWLFWIIQLWCLDKNIAMSSEHSLHDRGWEVRCGCGDKAASTGNTFVLCNQ